MKKSLAFFLLIVFACGTPFFINSELEIYTFESCLGALAVYFFSRPENGIFLKSVIGKLSLFLCALLFFIPLALMGNMYNATSGKQWIESVKVEPIFKKPFPQLVGIHLEIKLTEPVTPFFNVLKPSVQLIRRNANFTYWPEKQDKRNPDAVLKGPLLTYDLYANPYKDLTEPHTFEKPGHQRCLWPSVVKMMANAKARHIPEELSAHWPASSQTEMYSGILSRQLETHLRANKAFLDLFSDMRSIYEQYLTANLDKLGFKVCYATENAHTCYCTAKEWRDFQMINKKKKP